MLTKQALNFKYIIIPSVMMIIVFTYGYSANSRRYTYIGSAKCGECHSRAYRMNQLDIWLSSPHARAVRILSSDKGREIGSKKGVESPEKDLRCLKCHTTGGGENEITRNEGVGCEACHGPGSGYGTLDNHTDFRYRPNGYLRAKKNGMYPVLDYEPDLKKREKICLSCHREDRPCLPATIEEIHRQKITIQTVDTLRKGDLNLIHPINSY